MKARSLTSPPVAKTPVKLIACRLEDFDRAYRAQLAQLTQGISPASLISAYMDWLVHLSISPGKQIELMTHAQQNLIVLSKQVLQCSSDQTTPCIQPLSQDKRFKSEAWQSWPFNLFYQSFLLNQQWWHRATSDVVGVSAHHKQMTTFFARQWLDVFSPSNFLLTNPEVLAETLKTRGNNLLKGAQNKLNNAIQIATGKTPKDALKFRPGHEVAVTPGKVIFRNHLIELIQYSPQTEKVFPEPILIVPSWIMKYYILDLSPQNSLVRYLVDQGHTVFMVSWKNPDASDSHLGMDDYLKDGVMAAMDAVSSILPQRKIQATGYCLGGTLLSIAAAYMARKNDERLQSLTLLASELDFSEPGELGLFIDESQLAYLQDLMSEKGYLDGKQMAGAFAMLNSRDLVWSRMEHEYLMGNNLITSDLSAWNADATRMPYRQHLEYLRSLYLHNDLAEGRYLVEKRPIALSDIRIPVFVVATQKDTVSPWFSVYKLHLLTDTEITFCLTSGGHNVGIVNPPGLGAKRSYQLATRIRSEHYVDPATWFDTVTTHEGSWWPSWEAWLHAHSTQRSAPPPMGDTTHNKKLVNAPGHYVLSV